MTKTELFEAECASVGRDCAAAKLRFDPTGPAAYRSEYQAYQGERRRADYFSRKLLGLRLNAVKRGKVVDRSVTADVLKRVIGERCPVSLEAFTLDPKTQSNLNPSVDRLVNEVSYTRGNICVLTQTVNRAKGNKTFEEVAEIASSGQDRDGLKAIEWARLCSLMYGAWARAYKHSDPYLMPLAAIPGADLFMSTSQVVQYLMMRHFQPGGPHALGTEIWLGLTRQCGCEERLFLGLRDGLIPALSQESHLGNAWLHGEAFDAFVDWYRACEDLPSLLADALSRQQAKNPYGFEDVEWQLVSSGG